MDLSHTLIHHTIFNINACLVDCASIHTIFHHKKYFFNLLLVKSNVKTISSPVDLIQGFEKTTIILPSGTKIHINDALCSTKFK